MTPLAEPVGKAEECDDTEVRRPAVSSHPSRATRIWSGTVVRSGDTEVVLPRAGGPGVKQFLSSPFHVRIAVQVEPSVDIGR